MKNGSRSADRAKAVTDRFLALIAFFSTGFLGSLGCQPASTSSFDTTGDDLVMRATSPACAMARNDCRTQAQPIIDAIKAACAGVATACSGERHLPVPDAAAPSADGGSSCADARSACGDAIAQNKPALQMIGQSCSAEIRAACAPSRASDAAANDASQGGGPTATADAGGNACLGAVQTCHGQLADIRAMPPADCVTAQMACAGSHGFTSSSDQCPMAAAACRSALEATVTATLSACSAQIAASCGHHRG